MRVTTKKVDPICSAVLCFIGHKQTNKPTPKQKSQIFTLHRNILQIYMLQLSNTQSLKYPINPHQSTQPGHTHFSATLWPCLYSSPILCHGLDLSDSFFYSSGTKYFKSTKRLFLALVLKSIFSLENYVLVQCEPS